MNVYIELDGGYFVDRLVITERPGRVLEASLWKVFRREAVQDDVGNDGERRLRLSKHATRVGGLSRRGN